MYVITVNTIVSALIWCNYYVSAHKMFHQIHKFQSLMKDTLMTHEFRNIKAINFNQILFANQKYFLQLQISR